VDVFAIPTECKQEHAKCLNHQGHQDHQEDQNVPEVTANLQGSPGDIGGSSSNALLSCQYFSGSPQDSSSENRTNAHRTTCKTLATGMKNNSNCARSGFKGFLVSLVIFVFHMSFAFPGYSVRLPSSIRWLSNFEYSVAQMMLGVSK